MDDDADLLASLVDDNDLTDNANTAEASALSSQSNGQVDADPAHMNNVMVQMAKMQEQIATLQAQLKEKSTESTAASKPAAGVRRSEAVALSNGSGSEALFRKNEKRTARTGLAAQLSQQESLSQSSQGSVRGRERSMSTPSHHPPSNSGALDRSRHTPTTSRKASTAAADDKSVKEQFSGLHLINPRVSSTIMAQRMENRRMIRLARLCSNTLSPAQLGDSWVTIGVIIKKNTKQSNKGTSYSIWSLSDLSTSSTHLSLFLFGKAHSEHWKLSECSVVAILTPEIMDKRSDSDTALKISDADNLMVLGQSRDAGLCKSVTKNGTKCTNIINKDLCDYCEYHVQTEYRRQSAKRMECQGASQRPQTKSIMERVIGRNNSVNYGGQSYGVPSKTTRDLQGVKTSAPMAKRSLHQMLVPNSSADVKELEELARRKPSTVTRATGQVTCSSAGGTSEVFKKMLSCDTPGTRLLRGASEGDSKFEGPNRTARDLLVEEDQVQGHTRTGVGSMPVENGRSMKCLKERKSTSDGQVLSSRPELGGGKQVASRGGSSGKHHSVGDGKQSMSAAGPGKGSKAHAASSSSFSDALVSAGAGMPSKRKSASQAGGDQKRSQSSGNSLRSEDAATPLGGEAFSEDHMILDDAFGEDNSLQRYVKSSSQRVLSGGSSGNCATPSLGRGLVRDSNSAAMVDMPSVVSMVLTGSSRIADEIQRKRQEDAKQRAVAALKKSGGLACASPNEVPGRRSASAVLQGSTKSSQSQSLVHARAAQVPGKGESSAAKPRLSSLVEMSADEVKRVSKAQSSHYDEAKLLELEEQERYFNKLERKEDMENKMKTVTEIKVKVVQCKKCNYVAESPSRRCTADHKDQLVWSKTIRRFFECEGCKQRETTFGGAWPTVVCRCGLSNYRRVSMFKEKSFKKQEFEWNSSSLLIRGPEQAKFIAG